MIHRNIQSLPTLPLNHDCGNKHPGDFIYMPAGASHQIHIGSDATCICIGIALDWKPSGNGKIQIK